MTIVKSFLFMSSLYFLVCLAEALDPSRPNERGGKLLYVLLHTKDRVQYHVVEGLQCNSLSSLDGIDIDFQKEGSG